MKIVGYVFLSLAAIVVVFSLMFGLTWLGIEWRGFFGPKQAAVEREVFESTRSYNQAKIQELAKYRLEYLKADDNSDKSAIASTIRIRFADYDPDSISSIELRNFLKEINQ